MATTKNLGLHVVPSTDTTTLVREWIDRMAASDEDSNMQKIDKAMGDIADALEEILYGDGGGTASLPDGDEVKY